MEPGEYAYLLTSWLSPGVIAKASQDWSGPPQGHETVTLTFDRAELRTSADGRIDWFVRNFLEHFRVPDELRMLSAGLYPQQIDDSAKQWLASDQLFTGTLEFHDEASACKTLYTVRAPVYEIRLIWPCLTILNKLVAIYFSYYRNVFDKFGESDIHFPPHGEWPFLVWIGAKVARSCGFAAAGGVGLRPPPRMTHMISNIRGTAIVNGSPPTSEEELNAMAIAAQRYYRKLSRDHDLFESVFGS